jgi:hypothetical protein
MPFPTQGRGLLIRALALAAFVVFLLAGGKTASVYRSTSQLSDYIRGRALQASAESTPAARLQADVAAYAATLGLPVSPDDVQIDTRPGAVSIKLNYTVPVRLGIVHWNLRFTPAVESRAY